jgi:phytoene synthase
MDSYGHCETIVRAGDRDHYLADLYAPPEARQHLFALHAFDLEVRRIPDLVSEPMPGEIRLQWWRDALHDREGGHPVANALIETIRAHSLPLAAFDRLLEARTFDLYNDPMPSLADFEGYAGDTASSMIQLGALILADGRDSGAAEAAGHAGVALAMTSALRSLSRDASRRRFYLPADRAKAAGVDLETLFAGKATPPLKALLGEMRTIARGHLAASREAMLGLPPAVLPAFLPLALVEPHLRITERLGFDPFHMPVEIPAWRRQWLLWRAASRGGRRM